MSKIVALDVAHKIHLGLTLASVTGMIPGAGIALAIKALGAAFSIAESAGKNEVAVTVMDALWAEHAEAKAGLEQAIVEAKAEGR